MNWICKVFGHDYHVDAARYYGVYDCERCGTECGDEPGLLRRRFWEAKDWTMRKYFNFKHWLRCDECGLMFGKHSDKYDHLPF